MKTALKTSNPVRLATDCLVIAVGAKSKLEKLENEILKAFETWEELESVSDS